MARDYRQYLRPDVLSRIAGLELRARFVVEGYFTGMHRSPHRGVSVEYADHRPYAQGDEIRHIDWKVFARTDRYFIKEFEQETNLECMIVVDASESMSYRSSKSAMSKYEYATVMAAAIAYLALNKQRDSVGLCVFDEKIRRYHRPSRNPAHWKTIIDELDGKCGPAKTGIRPVLDDLAERLDHRMLVIVLSDLFDDVQEVLRGLYHLRHRGNEMIVCSIWDDAEYDLPFKGPTRFEGLESAGALLTEPRALRDRYLKQVDQFFDTLRAGCHRLRIDHAPFRTSTPLDVGLSAYFATRSSKIRKRSSHMLSRS